MHIDFTKCHNKQQVLEQQAEYAVDIDNLIEFCHSELNLTEEQLNNLHDWQYHEQARLGRLARQQLAKLGFTYHVKPEVL
jgi:hypothetical protein